MLLVWVSVAFPCPGPQLRVVAKSFGQHVCPAPEQQGFESRWLEGVSCVVSVWSGHFHFARWGRWVWAPSPGEMNWQPRVCCVGWNREGGIAAFAWGEETCNLLPASQGTRASL